MPTDEFTAHIESMLSTETYDPSERYTREQDGVDYAKSKASTIRNTEKLRAQEAESCRLQGIVDSYSSTILKLEDELQSLGLSLVSAIEAEKDKDALEQRKRKCRDEMAQKMAKEAVHVTQKVKLQNQFNLKTEEMSQLKVRKSVLTERLLSTDPHVVKTYTWIQHNKDLFKGEVYNPALSPMTLKGNQYADQVEAIIGSTNLTQFICEFEVDYKVLRTAVNTLEYRVHIIWTDFSTEHNYSKPSLKIAELATSHKMDYFVSSLINAPRFAIHTLCLQSNINNTPVSLKPIADPSQIKLPSFAIDHDLYKMHTTSDGRHCGQSKMNILPSVYLQMGICRSNIENLQGQIEHLQAKLSKESQAIPSYRSSVKESEEIDNPNKRSSDCLNEDAELDIQDIQKRMAAVKRDIKETTTKLDAAKKDLEEHIKGTDDLLTSGEYFDTLRDFIISTEKRTLPNVPLDTLELYIPKWNHLFPKQE